MFSRRLRSNRPERALADDQAESVAEHEAQTLVKKALESLSNKSPAHECAVQKASSWRPRALELLS